MLFDSNAGRHFSEIHQECTAELCDKFRFLNRETKKYN